MANIQPYEQTSFPTGPIGVPAGVANSSLGRVYRDFAGQLGQLNNDVMQAQSYRTQRLGGFLSQGAYTLGNLIARANQARIQRRQMGNALTVNQAFNKMQQNSNDLFHQFKQAYLDRPEDARDNWRAAIDTEAANALDTVSKDTRNDPKSLSQIQNAVQNAKTQAYARMDDWIDNRRVQQSGQIADQTIAQNKQRAMQLSGSLDTKVQDYLESTKLADDNLIGLEPALGSAVVALKRLELHNTSSGTLFANISADAPQDPEQRLSYIQQARTLLDSAHDKGIHLQPGSKQTLQSHFNTLEQQAYQDLRFSMSKDENAHDSDVRLQKLAIDADWTNKPVQEQALTDAKNQAAALRLKQDQIMNPSQHPELDPDTRKVYENMPPKVANAWIQSLNTKIGHLDALTNAASGHLKAIEAMDRADAREALAIKKRAEAEAAKALREANKAGADDEKSELNEMHNQLFMLNADPVTNIHRIEDLANEIYRKAGSAKYLTKDKMFSYQQRALKAQNYAHSFIQSTPNIFGITLPWGKPQVKQDSLQGKFQQRSEALKGLQGVVQEMREAQKHDAANDLAGLTPAQQDYYNTNYTLLKQTAAREGWSPAELNIRASQLRALAPQMVPSASTPKQAKAAPPAHPAKKGHKGGKNILVPPPPPPVPIFPTPPGVEE